MEIIGLNEDNIEKISNIKCEDIWVSEYRKKAYKSFLNQQMPSFGPNVDLDFNKIIYYHVILKSFIYPCFMFYF